jgi:hypothetical protein
MNGQNINLVLIAILSKKPPNSIIYLCSQGHIDEAANEFFSREHGVVNINGNFSEGLYRRRQAELELWNDKT